MSKIVEPNFVHLEPSVAKPDYLTEKFDQKLSNPDFYIFTKRQILTNTTPTYRKFLREAGYVNLDYCKRLEIAKGILEWNEELRDISLKLKLNLTGENGDYVVRINQKQARKLVEGNGCRILTTGLMYNLFIPYIKKEAENGDEDAEETLEEMTDSKSEWLEDLVIASKNKLKIKNNKVKITFPKEEGKFNGEDLSDFGYPKKLIEEGEFEYSYIGKKGIAVMRYAGERLCLSCSGSSSDSDSKLGVRLARFVMEKK